MRMNSQRNARASDIATPLVEFGGRATSCAAPQLQMYLFANGDVGPCCRNMSPLGNVTLDRLHDIWFGEQRRELLHRLAHGDLTAGCGVCEAELKVEGRAGSTPGGFDHWANTLGMPGEDGLPVRIEFELSNACNLMCLQCNGNLSSAIRRRRERRSPLECPYDDTFLKDLRPFLPGLRQASFTGGEPFLAPINFSVWELLSEANPDVDVTIVTNGTVWNDPVAEVLGRLRVQPVVSVDAFTKETYESIRLGSRHERVMENLRRFSDYSRQVGTHLNINMCLMPQSIQDFPLMISFAEDEGMYVNPQIVRSPAQYSLAHLEVTELMAIHRELLAWDARIGSSLVTNAEVWRTELARIESWIGGETSVGAPSRWTLDSPKILMFQRRIGARGQRHGPYRAKGPRSITFRVGTDERIRDAPEELSDLLETPLDQVEGATPDILWRVVATYEVVYQDDSLYEASLTLIDGSPASLSFRADRDEDGSISAVRACLEWSAP